VYFAYFIDWFYICWANTCSYGWIDGNYNKLKIIKHMEGKHEKLQRKRPLQRPNIKLDLREIGCEGKLAWDRIQWLSFMSM
jgi:hypothetical protein